MKLTKNDNAGPLRKETTLDGYADDVVDSVTKQEGVFSAYVASPLTSVRREQLEPVFNVVEKVCKAKGFNPYFPNKFTGPDSQPQLEPDVVYRIDRTRVNQSDVLILVALSPSFGAGQEIEIARNAMIPVIILYPSSSKISRMVKGLPIEHKEIIEFSDLGQLERKLSDAFNYYNIHVRDVRSLREKIKQSIIGVQIRKKREMKGLSISEMASKVGLTFEELKAIEEGATFEINPSFMLLKTISDVLDIDMAEIISPSYSEDILENVSSNMVDTVREILPLVVSTVAARSKDGTITDRDVATIGYRMFIEQLKSKK